MLCTRTKGFTLIELLVVIAIIAILAAILFPVFAQAREKARQISCSSNEKQIGLAIMQYVQDNDEAYPGSDWWDSPSITGWVTKVQPYIKSLAVFGCPDDSKAFTRHPQSGWAGVGLSYAGNAYRYTGVSQNPVGGPLGITQYQSWGVGNWMAPAPVAMAKINRPADTILVAERHSVDTFPLVGGGGDGLTVADFPTGNLITNDLGDIGQLIPDGTRAAAPYPNGPNGVVSANHAGKILANFLFCDGHVKSLRPTATNPDPTKNLDANGRSKDNMWDGARE